MQLVEVGNADVTDTLLDIHPDEVFGLRVMRLRCSQPEVFKVFVCDPVHLCGRVFNALIEPCVSFCVALPLPVPAGRGAIKGLADSVLLDVDFPMVPRGIPDRSICSFHSDFLLDFSRRVCYNIIVFTD